MPGPPHAFVRKQAPDPVRDRRRSPPVSVEPWLLCFLGGETVGQQPVELRFDHRVALADALLQFFAVEDGDVAARIVDQSRCLQVARSSRLELTGPGRTMAAVARELFERDDARSQTRRRTLRRRGSISATPVRPEDESSVASNGSVPVVDRDPAAAGSGPIPS